MRPHRIAFRRATGLQAERDTRQFIAKSISKSSQCFRAHPTNLPMCFPNQYASLSEGVTPAAVEMRLSLSFDFKASTFDSSQNIEAQLFPKMSTSLPN